MNKLFLLICFAYTFLFALPSTAATYYLDFTNGSNANDGLSEMSAWKDLFKIRDLGPMPGDTFLFKYGERWEGPQLYVTASGAAGDPIVYSAYGNPADGLPIISCIDSYTDATLSGNWSSVGGNIWTLALPSSPGRLFIDGTERLRSSTLADVGTIDNESELGEWFFDLNTNLLHLSSPQNPALEYSLFQGSTRFISALVENASHMVFEKLDLRGGTGAALWLSGATNVVIRDCNLGHSGNSGLLISDNSGSSNPSTDILIENNLFSSNFTFFHGLGAERGCGDGVRLADGALRVVVRNNEFLNWAHNAIELLGDNATNIGTNDNQFYDNNISAPAIPYARAFGADGLLGKCQNNQFYRNFVRDVRTTNQVNGNNNWVHHNIILSMRNSPARTNGVAYGFTLGVYGAGLVCQDNLFDHNLIFDTDEAAFLIRGFGFTNQAQGNAIRNNIIYNTGVAPLNNTYNSGTAIILFDTNQDGVGGNTFQNNLCYNDVAQAVQIYLQDSGTYLSVAQFNAQNGVEANVISDNLDGDPLFTDFAGGNYLPLANSLLIDNGINTGLLVDYAQNPRLQGSAVDIGPLERDPLISVPVDLLTFTGTLSPNNQVQLFWQTATEINNLGFQIEHSPGDAGSWQVIGFLEGAGNSLTPLDYHFVHEPPGVGIHYYRLKQLDVDGPFEYSKIIHFDLSLEEQNLVLYPTVTKNSLSIEVSTSTGKTGPSEVTIFNTQGKVLLKFSDGQSKLDVSRLQSGTYLAFVRWGSEWDVRKFIKKD